MNVENFILISAILGFIAFFGDFILTFIFGFFKEDYSFFEDTMSELGNRESRFKTFFRIWWIVWGICIIIFGIGFGFYYYDSLYEIIIITTVILISIFGFGAGIVVGIFPEDPKGEQESISGKLHGIFAGIGFIAILVVPSVLGSVSDKIFLAVSVIVQIFSVIFFILFILSKYPKIGKSGLWQRLFLLTNYCYLIIYAFFMFINPDMG
jgi:hypothetical protein